MDEISPVCWFTNCKDAPEAIIYYLIEDRYETRASCLFHSFDAIEGVHVVDVSAIADVITTLAPNVITTGPKPHQMGFGEEPSPL